MLLLTSVKSGNTIVNVRGVPPLRRGSISDEVERRPFDLEEVINTDYSYSDMQPLLFVIPSYAELKEQTRKYIESFGK